MKRPALARPSRGTLPERKIASSDLHHRVACDIIWLLMGAWLSWLERTVHIREVTGSNPVAPTWQVAEQQGTSARSAISFREPGPRVVFSRPAR
jgi:hypothetical protein